MPPRGSKAGGSKAAKAAATDEPEIAAAESTGINPGPVEAFPSPAVEAVENVIDMDHPMRHDDTMEYEQPANQPEGQDLPGPSSTYIPRQPSPPLPDLSSRPFPPDEDDIEEDDEVVAKLPIYLSPSLFPHLHLFQFPLSHKSLAPSTWARDRGKHISTRVKEKVGRVEVEIPVDGGENVWRDDKARDLGFVMDVNAINGHADDPVGGYSAKSKEKKKEGKKKKHEKWGDKTRYRSELVPNATGYYSGVVHNGALHLHPISKVMQFRTNLQYLDDADAANRDRASRRSEDDDDDRGGAKAGDARAKAAVLSQNRTRRIHEEQDNDGSGSIKDFRTKMWNTAADEDLDPWVSYAWKVEDDDRVAQSLGKLYVPENKQEKLECRTRGLDYLNRPEGI